MSALFTVFSFQTTVSLFVYSLSNWIALIEMFLIFGLFLKNSERHLVKSTVSLSFLGIISNLALILGIKNLRQGSHSQQVKKAKNNQDSPE